MSETWDVTYLDGTKAVVQITPWIDILVERKHRVMRDGQWLELTWHRIYEALSQSGAELRPFDEWMPTVDEATERKKSEPGPTPPDQELDFSSESVPEPASLSST